MPVVEQQTPELTQWNDLPDDVRFSGILLGNGASRAIWDRFAYSSLYDVASNVIPNYRLEERDQALFASFGTTNFELVLAAISTTRQVGEVLGWEVAEAVTRYDRIRNALVESVHTTHIPWAKVSDDVLETLSSELSTFRFVYSSNYDLLIYWALMHHGPQGFVDFFWSDLQFDITNTDVWRKATEVYYLHGGIHLLRTPSGSAMKRTAGFGGNLLDQFGRQLDRGFSPLFVSEGCSADKMRVIRGSDYLSFGHEALSQNRGSLFILGHSMGDSDSHLVHAINQSPTDRIGFSILPSSDDDVIKMKGHVVSRFPKKKLVFIDSTSHPLGAPGLSINP